MKRKTIIVLLVILTGSFGSQLFAQETMEVTKQRTKSNNTNERTIEQSSSACVGKIRCADGTCSISFDQEIVSPRDAASGLPTGKRQHKPFVITKELDKSTPMMLRESPSKASTGKVSYSDLSITMTHKGGSKKLPVVNNQFTLPTDCPDGEIELIASWSWGATNEGTDGIKRYEAPFALEVKGGEFASSKYTKTGHVTLMK